KLLEHLRILSSDDFEGRLTGEEGNRKGRAYIIKEFTNYKVQPLLENFEQAFTFQQDDREYKANNVLGLVKGSKYPNKYVVISAHHDHVGVIDGEIYNGTDDNASGVAALLAFAEYLSKNPPEYSVILAAFDAEELGLWGSSFFLESFKDEDIMININMDMISRSDKRELYMVGSRYNDKLKLVTNKFENNTNSKLIVGHDGSDGKDDWTYAADHAPFHEAGIPFLYFGNEDHKDYHQPTDDFEFVTTAFYKDAVTLIISLYALIDQEGL
ncbi:MAG: M28 family peptidase, partial [Bacteroidota bacterium]